MLTTDNQTLNYWGHKKLRA